VKGVEGVERGGERGGKKVERREVVMVEQL
jgi:hypothetical protein